jgi:chromosome segregation ATPase
LVSFSQLVADMFDFDVSQYWDPNAATSRQQTATGDGDRDILAALILHLERSTEELIPEAPAIRALLADIVDRLPEALADQLNAVAFIDSHRLRFSRARSRLAARKENLKSSDAVELQKAEVLKHKAAIDELNLEPAALDAEATTLRQEITDLESTLAAKRQRLEAVEKRRADLPTLIDQEEAALKTAIVLTAQMKKSLKKVEGTTEADVAIINEVDSIRLNVLEGLRQYLG